MRHYARWAMPGTFPNIKSTQAKQPKRPVRAGSVAVNDSVSGSCRMVVRLALIAEILLLRLWGCPL